MLNREAREERVECVRQGLSKREVEDTHRSREREPCSIKVTEKVGGVLAGRRGLFLLISPPLRTSSLPACMPLSWPPWPSSAVPVHSFTFPPHGGSFPSWYCSGIFSSVRRKGRARACTSSLACRSAPSSKQNVVKIVVKFIFFLVC